MSVNKDIKANNLQALYPDIAKEYDVIRNGKQASEVASRSSAKVYWLCSLKHSYQTSVYDRTRTDGKATGCPYCTNKKVLVGYNDLNTKFPEIAKEWCFEKNEKKPQDYVYGSGERVYWKCALGHIWSSQIVNRTFSNRNCPFCANKKVWPGFNDLASTHPELVKDWDYKKNDKLPSEYIAGTHIKVSWICNDCGYNYRAQIKERAYGGTGCPKCANAYKTSEPEQILHYYLKQLFVDCCNSYHAEWLGNREIDIYIPSLQLAIEYDGGHWHKDTFRDIEKSKILIENDIQLIRIREDKNAVIDDGSYIIDVHYDADMQFMAGVIDRLLEYINCKQNEEYKIDFNIERDRSYILAQYENKKRDKSLAMVRPELIAEWDNELNHPLTPEKITYGSNKKVNWICSKCGFKWQQIPHTRKKLFCEHCNKTRANNERTILKINSGKIKSLLDFPEIMKDWDYDKNTVDPSTISYGNDKWAYWKCHKCGYEWLGIIKNRTTSGQGCQKCSSRHLKKVICIETGEIFESIKAASIKYGVSSSAIGMCCNGKSKTSSGYHWKYYED